MSQGLNTELSLISLFAELTESVRLTLSDEPDESADILIIATAMTTYALI